MKKVLLIAGGGTLGYYTASELLRLGHCVDIICPEDKVSDNSQLRYFKALGTHEFLTELFAREKYDGIVNFIHYKQVDEYKKIHSLLIKNTSHLIFLSSYRVYAGCECPIREDSPRIYDTTDNAKFFTEEDYANRLVTVGHSALAKVSNDQEAGSLNDAKELLSFSGEGGKAEEKTLLIRIWIEGTDREAEKAHVGGKLQYKFHFVSMDRFENGNNEFVSEINYDPMGNMLIAPEGVTASMQYSFNGIDWVDYTPGTQISTEDKTKLMVRFAQTVRERSSTVKSFDLINDE